jgi:hypothetical protein
MQKKIVASAVTVIAALWTTNSKAAVVLSDNFDSYTSGTNLVGQGAWGQTGTSTATPIQVTGTGNLAASLGTSGQDAYEPFTSVVPHTAGNELVSDLTINVAAAQATGDYFFHLTPDVGDSSLFYERLFAKSTTGGYLLGLESTAGTGAVITYGTTVLPLNTAEDVEIDWNFLPGTTSDTFAVSVDGTPYAGLTSVAWTSVNAEPSALAAVNLRQGTAANAPTLTVDNISITSVSVPEPASLGLIAAVGGMLLARPSRRA